MTSLRRFAGLAAAPLVLAACAGEPRQPTLRPPAGWVVVPAVTRLESAAGSCANDTREQWQVALDADSTRLLVTPHRYDTRPAELRMEGGELVAMDMGEFGGHLAWHPDGGERVEVIPRNTQALVTLPSGIYAFGGLAHMDMDEGWMDRVSRGADGRWRAERVLELLGAPGAVMVLDGEAVLVATSGALEIVMPQGTRQVVHRNEMWHHLYANSLVQDREGIIYVGMRSAVARLTPGPDGMREEWLSPAGTCGRGIG